MTLHMVRVNRHTSNFLTLSNATALCCSLYIHISCMAKHSSNSTRKFADNTIEVADYFEGSSEFAHLVYLC